MVKWPFGKVKWPPTRESKGHFESPGTHSFSAIYRGTHKTPFVFVAGFLEWKIAEPDPWFLGSKSVLTRRLSCFPRACVMCPPPGQDDFLFRGGHETWAFETVRGYAFTIIKGSRLRRSPKDPCQVLLLRLHSMTFFQGWFLWPKIWVMKFGSLGSWWMVYLLKITFVYHHLQSAAKWFWESGCKKSPSLRV